MPGNDEVPHHEGAPPQGTTGEHRHDSKPAETQGADHGDEAFEFLNEAAGIEEER